MLAHSGQFALPASLAPILEMTGNHSLVLLLSALVLALAWATIAGHRRREREQREHLRNMREREQRLRLSLWASNEIYWQYDLRKRELEKTRVEPDADNNLSVRVELQQHPKIHADDLPTVRSRLRAYLRGHAPIFLSEHRMLDDDGEPQWVRVRGRAVRFGHDGRISRIAGTARNISPIRELQREREIATEVMRNMAEAVAIMDTGFHIVAINPAFTRITGYSQEDALGQDAGILNSERHDTAFYLNARQEIRNAGDGWTGEMWQTRKDGRDILCAMRCNLIEEPDTSRQFYVMVANDITERRRIEHELRYLANYDTLTNLPNRTLLTERLSHAIVRARRQKSNLALLFLDLDKFKDVNDSLGHASGDRILRLSAQRLQEAVGKDVTVARVSGDEFTVILEDIADVNAASECAQRIINAFDAPMQIDNRKELIISPSIGISLFPEHALVPTDLLKHADTAMYKAKASGRRAYMCYSNEMDADIHRRIGLTASLRRVIERGELQLVFQPQLHLASGRINAVEALLRWRSPEHGEVPPSQFIPLAEESGMIIAIGEWVLQEACRTRARWHAAGVDPHLVMSVNVSALQLQRSDLADFVQTTLAENALPPSTLELELTESVLMANAEFASECLRAFRDMGISIAVDDFGTGYSSLTYLHRLPINTLKIDKAFIDGLSTSGHNEDTSITTTVIAMARTLGLRVIAEGVETLEQLQFLRQNDCTIAQGYWISRPLSADDCLDFIRASDSVVTPGGAALDPAMSAD